MTSRDSSNGQHALNMSGLLDLKTWKQKGNMGQDNHLEAMFDRKCSSIFFTNQGCIGSTKVAGDPFL
ncbi:hypothetical protein KSF_087740 [Reticulibacter mediterranei]|uniref:Uncharacterized protein n=1 Tax=Reticulibacter mediterranei TaxID=2778369 RepID=A0A8J3IQ61_9CHLR|nr:hypothetical protein KSF_087740 [Reticulibacter mediterranei]